MAACTTRKPGRNLDTDVVINYVKGRLAADRNVSCFHTFVQDDSCSLT